MMKRRGFLMVLLLASTVLLCSCGQSCQSGKSDVNTKVVVVTAGHGFDREPFFAIFDALEGVDYVEAEQKDDSELFEDISSWDYDVIVLFNMTQKISPKRQANFKKLLDLLMKNYKLVILKLNSIENFCLKLISMLNIQKPNFIMVF